MTIPAGTHNEPGASQAGQPLQPAATVSYVVDSGWSAWWQRTNFGTAITGSAGLLVGCFAAWLIATVNFIARDNLIAYAGIGFGCVVAGLLADGAILMAIARRDQRKKAPARAQERIRR